MADEKRPKVNNHRNSNNGPRPRVNETLVNPDDVDNRINWDRKQKGKRRDDDAEEADEDDALEEDVDELPRTRSKKGRRKKQRQLVFDEGSGRVIVKRRRRRGRDGYFVDDLDDGL